MSDVHAVTIGDGAGIGMTVLTLEFEDASRAELTIHRSQKPERLADAIRAQLTR